MKLMRLALLLLVVLFLPPSVYAAAEITKERFESQGKQRAYYLFVPGSVKATAAVPLVILLHGSGRNGMSLVEKWKDLANKEGFIIAGPDALDSSGWRLPEDGPEPIYELAELLQKKYPIDPHHLYLFGHSAGAVFALNLAMFESEYFAAVAVHAGSWRSEGELSVIERAKRKTPIKIIVGDNDGYFPLASVKTTEAALKAGGFAIDVTVMKGHDHWYYDLAPEINRNAWAFLKQNTLAGDRRHGTTNFNSEGVDLNGIANQMNVLKRKVDNVIQQYYAKEEELRLKDSIRDKTAVSGIARLQVQLLTAGAATLREAAATAEGASKMKIPANYQQYFALLAQSRLKRAECLELLRTRAELLLSDEERNAVVTKSNELVNRVTMLNQEAEEMEQKAEQLVADP